MNPNNLLRELAIRPLLCDGAMGTQLFARGLQPGACGEQWNIDHPADVQAIHQAYRQAGCDLLTTNTFGANAPTLDRHSLANQVDALNRAGVQVAAAAANGGWVLGDVGPFGGFIEPVGDMLPEQLLEIFKWQIHALASAGCDGIIIETMSDPAELAIAIRAAKSVSNKPVIATYAFARAPGHPFRTMMGTPADQAIAQAIDAGADVVGSNCGTALSLEDYLQLADVIVKAAGTTPAILQPNAGSPTSADGKLVYPATPADMAAIVKPLLSTGLRIIGGCCGTTPAHLQAMAGAIRK